MPIHATAKEGHVTVHIEIDSDLVDEELHQTLAKMLEIPAQQLAAYLMGSLFMRRLLPIALERLCMYLAKAGADGASLAEQFISGETDPEVVIAEFLAGDQKGDESSPFSDYLSGLDLP